MKQEFKILRLAVSVLLVSLGIAASETKGQQAEGRRGPGDEAPILRQYIQDVQADVQAGRLDRPEPRAAEGERTPEQVEARLQRQRLLDQIDAEIARLRQMTQEAEQIRNDVARQAGRPEAQRPQIQRRQQAVVPTAPSLRPGARNLRQSLPPIARPQLEAAIDSLPRMMDQLRDSFNNSLDRMHNVYQKIQGRFTNLEEENERLRDQNQQLRDENQKLRERLQQAEPQQPRRQPGPGRDL